MKELKIMKALRYLLIVMGLMSVLSINPPPVWFTRVRSCLLRLRKERT